MVTLLADRGPRLAYDPAVPDELTSATYLRAHPDLAELRRAVRLGDWALVASGVGGCEPGSDRSFLFDQVVDEPGARRMLEPVAEQDPLAGALLACVEVREAWAIRTSRAASQVSAEQFRGFRAGLVAAEQRLTRLIARHPDSVDAWRVRLITARGLELGHSEARRRWQRARALAPDDVWAHRLMLKYWLPKWFGSWELAEGFVDDAVRDAPAGSLLHVLVADLLLERWSDLDGGEPGQAYLNQPRQAHRATTAAAQGPQHPSFGTPYGWPDVDNHFAMLFSLAGADHLARVHFERLGPGLATDVPWVFLQGRPGEQFEKRRRRATGARR